MFESIDRQASASWKLRIALAVLIVALGAGAISVLRMTQMPLKSFEGPLPALSETQMELASRLGEHVRYLSGTVGVRNVDPVGSLPKTEDYLREELVQAGYTVKDQTYTVQGDVVRNLEVELAGSSSTAGIIVVGAHYDTVPGTFGADDNASGVAATLELARLLKTSRLRRTIRFVFFVNEEPPYFQTSEMGSLVYARKLHRDAVPVSAMISLEMLGFYSDSPGSQKYPPLFSVLSPSRGNFIAFVGNPESRDLVRKATRRFRESAQFPSEGVAAPSNLPGVGWSDHWSFWQQGYPAIMVTDTALFRNPYYHTFQDTAERLDFNKMARVVEGIRSVVASLADEN
jgi:Zn-dependent M28 family amino/carboxypeptidase